MQLKWFSLGHWVPEPLYSRSLFLSSNGSCVTLIVHLGLSGHSLVCQYMCNLFSCPVTTNYMFVNVMRVGSWVKSYSSNFTRRSKAGPLRYCWNGCGPRCCGAFGVYFLSKIPCSSFSHLRLLTKCYSLELNFLQCKSGQRIQNSSEWHRICLLFLEALHTKILQNCCPKNFYHRTITFLSCAFIHLNSVFLPAYGVQLIQKFTGTFHLHGSDNSKFETFVVNVSVTATVKHYWYLTISHPPSWSLPLHSFGTHVGTHCPFDCITPVSDLSFGFFSCSPTCTN